MAAFGASAADLAHADAIRADRPFEVWPENWESVRVFLALSTQWRLVGVSTMAEARILQTGLDYSAIEPVMRLMGIKLRSRAALFENLQVMEQAVLDVVLAS